MVAEVTPNYDSQWAAIGAVAQKLGVGIAETVRTWVSQAETTPASARARQPRSPRS
jgi:transposase